MITVRCKKIEWQPQELVAKVKKKRIESLGHFGGKVRLTAQRSIIMMGAARKEPKGAKARARWLEEIRKRPHSPPGSPPYTHTGTLRKSIAYAVASDKSSVVIGPNAADMDQVGGLHEFGGVRFSREHYAARPYMGPALDKIIPEIPRYWLASIHK